MSAQVDADVLLVSILARLPSDQRSFLVRGDDEQLVRADVMTGADWLDEQLRLRGQRWGTDDRRVLATLWWYSASAWVVGPTLTSLALAERVLSADVEDLAVHWLPDSRITGATSSRVLSSEVSSSELILAAGESLRGLYERVIPAVGGRAGIGLRPLWAIAADAIATRLVAIGRAVGDIDRVTALLEPLSDAIGPALPRARYVGTGASREPKRLSCCLLYLAPGQSMCGFCPKLVNKRTAPP